MDVSRFDCSVLSCAETPKSAILTWPWRVSSRLPALTSRWMSFLECRYVSDTSTEAHTMRICAAVSVVLSMRMASATEPGSHSSMTIHSVLSLLNDPRYCTTKSFLQSFKMSTSRRSDDMSSCMGITLTATPCCVRRSLPTNTLFFPFG